MAWGTNLLFFVMVICLAYFGTIVYRSMPSFSSSSLISPTNHNTVESIEFNQSPAIIPASNNHTASLIFLHGLGDVGESWLQAFHRYKIPKDIGHIKFIFPSAPIRRITLNNGRKMPGWFDMYGRDLSAKQDQKGTLDATTFLNGLIEQEIKNGIPSQRIMIGGFSQGGATVLHCVLTTPHILAGALALSTCLPLASTFPKALVAGAEKVNLPVLQCHGTADPLVLIKWGQSAAELFKTMGFQKYTFKHYSGMSHSTSDQEMLDVLAFIKQYLPKI